MRIRAERLLAVFFILIFFVVISLIASAMYFTPLERSVISIALFLFVGFFLLYAFSA